MSYVFPPLVIMHQQKQRVLMRAFFGVVIQLQSKQFVSCFKTKIYTERTKGTYVVPYVEGLSQQFKRATSRYNFKIVTRPGEKKETDLKTKARHPLGDKRSNVVYIIPFGFGRFEYIGET